MSNDLTSATAPDGVAIPLDDARRLARLGGGPAALTAFCGHEPKLVIIDRGPYEIRAVRSDPSHTPRSLRAATRALLATSGAAGISVALWRSTPIGHWMLLTHERLIAWLLPAGQTEAAIHGQRPAG